MKHLCLFGVAFMATTVLCACGGSGGGSNGSQDAGREGGAVAQARLAETGRNRRFSVSSKVARQTKRVLSTNRLRSRLTNGAPFRITRIDRFTDSADRPLGTAVTITFDDPINMKYQVVPGVSFPDGRRAGYKLQHLMTGARHMSSLLLEIDLKRHKIVSVQPLGHGVKVKYGYTRSELQKRPKLDYAQGG